MKLLELVIAGIAGVIFGAVFLLLRLIGLLACVLGGIFMLVFVISGLSWLAWHKAAHWAGMTHSGEALALMLAIAIVTRYGWLLLIGEDSSARRRAPPRPGWPGV